MGRASFGTSLQKVGLVVLGIALGQWLALFSGLEPVQCNQGSGQGQASLIPLLREDQAFDPFLDGPHPLRIIKVASEGRTTPLFGLPEIWMSVHHNEYISDEMSIRLYGPSWWFKMLGAVQKDKLFVDVGFNIGGVGIVAAAQGMRVIGFEPVKMNWIIAQQSIKLNHLQSRVKLHHAAVHWNPTKMEIVHNFSKESDGRFNAGQGTLGVRTDLAEEQSTQHKELVDTISLDDAVTENVWLMKFDVEGCECHCLKSAENLFSDYEINYVFIETDKKAAGRCGCSFHFFVDFFTRHGFGACETFEGQGADRTCSKFEDITDENWFNYHDRFLRRRVAPLLPGKPMV
eukprot:m.27764 g.27764  ORF g.27764 m.27764 type:complete len:345 (+) comp15805_c0_seq2:135-1169(+)